MKTKLLTISAIAAFSLTGCAVKSLNPSPEVLKPEVFMPKQLTKTYSVKEGGTLKDLIKTMEIDSNGTMIIDKTKSNIVFDRAINDASMDELQSFIKLQYNRDIVLRKYSEKMFAIEEYTPELKTDFAKEGSFVPPVINFKLHGDFEYSQLFNLLRESGINIDVDIQNRAATEAFKLEKKAPEFSGNLNSFLSFIGAKENLFVRMTDTGVLLKDVDTVTYNLKLPKVKLDPALSPDGGKTAITGFDASGTAASGTSAVAAGSLSPLDNIEEQLKIMLASKAVYAINKTAGTLSVTGDYESIKTTDKIVQDFHDIYGKSIQLELSIYEVVINDSNSFGIDYTMLERDIIGSAITVTKNLSTSLTSNLLDSASLSVTKNGGSLLTVSENVPSIDGTTAPATTSTSAYEKTNGVVFKYLNKYGRASVITKPVLGTINNLPVKLDVVDSKDYVSKLTNTNTTTTGANVATGVTTSEPEIKTVTTGFSLILHPKVENDYIKIALKSVVSNLNGFNSYAYGADKENVIQLKDVSSRQFEEMVKLKNNEIAIVGGYMYTRRASDKNGLPFTDADDSIFDALSSAKSRTMEKVEIVMTIRARAI